LKKQQLVYYSLVISIVAIGIAIFSLIIDWQEFMFIQETNSPPDIVACLKSFSYEKGPEFDLGSSVVPIGEISFDLVNRGNTEAMVHRVDVFPHGKRADGEMDSMWLTMEVQQTVPGNGIITVEPFSFEDKRVQKNYWVEELEEVALISFWPNGQGPYLICKPDVVTVEESDWFCGYPYENGMRGENSCR